MQAIRVLRAQSRPASPASPAPAPLTDTVQSARNATAHAHGSATVPTEDMSVQHRTTPLSRIQNLTPFTKRSAHTPTPTPPPTPIPSAIVQDGTYLNTLGLKLNEAATRALVTSTSSGSGPDSFKGRKPLPAGRGRFFAALIET